MSNPLNTPKTVEGLYLLFFLLLVVLLAIAGEIEKWQDRVNGLPSRSVQGGW